MWNSSTGDCKCNKACKIDKCLDIKNFLCKKRQLGKLALAFEDQIFNTTETSLEHNMQKNYCLIH